MPRWPRPTTSARWSSASTTCSIPAPSTWAGTTICWPAWCSARGRSWSRCGKFRGLLGLINSPHNEHLLLRGLKTFELRMQRHNENGQRVAEFLAAHPRIERVYYPGLPSHPQHELARRTMRGFGGVVTFNVKDADWRQTADVVDARAHSADRGQPGRRGIAHRAAAGAELLREHAARAPRLGHSRQHDPPGLRHRERRGPDRRLDSSTLRVTFSGNCRGRSYREIQPTILRSQRLNLRLSGPSRYGSRSGRRC